MGGWVFFRIYLVKFGIGIEGVWGLWVQSTRVYSVDMDESLLTLIMRCISSQVMSRFA